MDNRTDNRDSDTSQLWTRAERLLSARFTLPLVLLTAALLRIGHILAMRGLPSFDTLLLDSSLYDRWAQSIAAGDWLGGTRAFYMDPLYPYLLSVVYRICGHDLLVVRLMQAGLGVGTCALVAGIGNRLGGRAVGNLAALVMAFYAPAIFNEYEIEKTALGVFLITAALALAVGRSAGSRFGAGIFLALATLTRGNLVAFVPLGALWLLSERPAAASTLSRISTAGALKNATLFLLGALLVFSPVLLRNHHVSGEWIIATSQAGANFYTGNNPANLTGAFEPVPFVRPYPDFEESDFRAEAERRTGHGMTPREISSFWFGESLRHMRDNPGFAATVAIRKFVLFWSDVELPDGSDMYFLRRYSPVLRLPLLTLGAILPLAMFGVFVTFRRSREARLLAGFVVLYSLTVIAFFIFSRYRLHVVPALAVFAALGVRWCCVLLESRSLHRIVPALTVACLAAAFSFAASSTFGVTRHEWPEAFEDLAELYENRGDLSAARGLLKEGMAQNPDRSRTVCALGRVTQKAGDHREAIRLLDRCLELDGTSPQGWYLLGVSYAASGDRKLARECFERQLYLTPGDADTIEQLHRLGSK